MSRYHESADDVPEGLVIPRWSWDGLQRSSPDQRPSRASLSATIPIAGALSPVLAIGLALTGDW